MMPLPPQHTLLPNVVEQDLNWLLNSPSVVANTGMLRHWLSDEFGAQAWARIEPLLHNARTCSDVNDWLSELGWEAALSPPPKTQRLGDYFEWLVSIWLALDAHFDVIGRNVPIRSTVMQSGKPIKHTHGELDVLMREVATGKVIHLEMAVKFYLGLDDTQLLSRWYDPSLHDRLDKKLAHMRWHQMEMAFTPEGEAVLHEQGVVVDEVWGMVKGRLFLPRAERLPTPSLSSIFNSPSTPMSAPMSMSSRCAFGCWMTASEFVALNTTAWRLSKYGWMRATGEGEGNHNFREAFDISQLDYGPQMVVLDDGLAGDLNSDETPTFIVPDAVHGSEDWVKNARAQQTCAENYPQYEQAYYAITYQSKELVFQINDVTALAQHSAPSFYLISAFNPKSKVLNDADNLARHRKLCAYLDDNKIQYLSACGGDAPIQSQANHSELSVAVLLDNQNADATANHIAELFAQNALVKYHKGQVELVWL